VDTLDETVDLETGEGEEEVEEWLGSNWFDALGRPDSALTRWMVVRNHSGEICYGSRWWVEVGRQR
jgi:hypothetical protein